MAKKSAMELLKELDAETAAKRAALLETAKAEAAEAIGKIADQLDGYTADFADLVHRAVKRFGVSGGKRTRGAAAAVSVSEADVAKVLAGVTKKASSSFQLAKAISLEPSVVSACMQSLKAAGKVTSSGKGKGTIWTKA